MARNEEKAQSMLNRWLAYKQMNKPGRVSMKKPDDPNEATTAQEADKWRLLVIRDIGKKMIDIQNESLGEQRIRDLNDEINELIKEKNRWEKRILELGGPNFRKYERKVDDVLMQNLGPDIEQGGYIYKYFGAARKLPGVKELFESKKQDDRSGKRSRAEFKGINAEYYGYRDEEDGTLEQLEKEAEERAVKRAINTWEKDQIQSDGTWKMKGRTYSIREDLGNDAPVPTPQQMEQLVIQKKKEELLKTYIGTQ
eukprot:CAMPEP_0168548402 /NCGR_PEP_ID=MMETSP0413-20121227/4538_1 /TAXON_ID=136452 /ORGANISM="Filamoeba nolandi, Strain NC-AS-23-1" /LENGTH=253 /DNA_ID=CAMNT_0008578695 /DNA_START=98 /DNA_END=859 /DNA_ORIENTATION=+